MMLVDMSTWLLFALPSLSTGVLIESHDTLNASEAVREKDKSPCSGRFHEDCTSRLGCKWDNDECNAHIAWLHVMKCGSSFGTTLAHFANQGLPETAHIPSGTDQSDPEDRTTEGAQGEPNFFRYKYPIDKYFKDVFRYPPNPGNHLPILDEEWDEWKHNWFGVFREPASRALSSFYHFGQGKGDMLDFVKKIQGQQASMLSVGATGMAKIRCEFNQTDAPTECDRMVEPDVPLAIQRLDGFAFVGILEEFDMSICLFHKMMGSKCLAVEFLNTREANYPGGDKMHEEELQKLREVGDPWDGPVYEAALRRFWGDVRKYDLKPSVCRELCPSTDAFKRLKADTDAFLFPEGF
jgi:hypothetical protein|eukprot:TRINITY_DN1609_c0_g3_i1.p1 TRINITY_DN1609_c0_g3~~TRINITY_DN1609_c0_g3_i1.p1  ORF type:complete len:352 (+),score=49.51 TRINITY_DN1609_c0_g3_i1:70-1125(+)